MLKAGSLNKEVKIQDFKNNAWGDKETCWAQITPKERVIYSQYASAIHGAEFVIRNTTITPAYAFKVGSQHYMIVDPIEEIENGAGIKISAAAVTLATCTRSAQTYTLGTLNRPEYGTAQTTSFPGILAQRYIRWEQQQPNAETEEGLILTVPKSVTLEAGDIVKISNKPYAVRTCYTLGVYHNDYEIVREADV